MRVFAGPNGSGKSTIFDQIQEKGYDIGFYINPDNIEQSLNATNHIQLSDYGIDEIKENAFDQFLKNHSFLKKAQKEGYDIQLFYQKEQNFIYNNSTKINSYQAALIADFLRYTLISLGKKLTFESVFSHPSKLDIFDYAISNGYKVYLYFICTESFEINLDRVAKRVNQGGHSVETSKIEPRYKNALAQLKPAVQKAYRSFLWDNSGSQAQLIIEIEAGKTVTQISDFIPGWIIDNLLNK